MLEMFSQFFEVISMVIRGLLSILMMTVALVTMIPKFLAFIFGLVAVAPPFISAFLIFGVVASVVLLILGRN